MSRGGITSFQLYEEIGYAAKAIGNFFSELTTTLKSVQPLIQKAIEEKMNEDSRRGRS